MISDEQKSLSRSLRSMLTIQGFKCSVNYTVDEVKTITTAQRIFWRYVK